MAGHKYLLVILALTAFSQAKSQQINYMQADSTTHALYDAGNWQNLIDYGKRTLATGVDFPLLHLRLGYAYYNTGNYDAALTQYEEVLSKDSYNQLARLYAYWCNRYLNQDAAAAYHASYLDADTRKAIHLSPFELLEADLESSIESNNNNYRGTASYTRTGLNARLGWRFQFDQSLAYFAQTIDYRPYAFNRILPVINNSVTQFEYYGKLSYIFTGRWSVFGGYHYVDTKYIEEKYNNNIALFGLKYINGITLVQADANFGTISAHKVHQYNAMLMLSPLGNLNLYFISRGSILQNRNTSNFVFSQTIGGKLFKHFWLDGNVTLGSLDNYTEADGLYLYNAIDITKFKTSATGYYSIGTHALVYVNYTYENKQDHYRNTTYYKQHSITGGVKWKF